MLDFNFLGITEDPLGCVGIYNDRYKKEDGVWKIQKRKIDFLHPNRILVGDEPGKIWS